MFRYLSFSLALLATTPVFAQINATVDNINSVYDADTFRVDIAGWPDIVGKNIPVRVNGVDAAEIRGKCLSEKEQAKAARDYTKAFLQSGSTIELRNIQKVLSSTCGCICGRGLPIRSAHRFRPCQKLSRWNA
ncbi:MAG: hypothetical protein DSY85_08235 [Marinomonas sp.]|nr:MAG: hypothetical protein DSY85_08235 [Marinomonas sp.]